MLERLARTAKLDGLIYTANSGWPPYKYSKLPYGLIVDDKLTSAAQKLEGRWMPAVYRKVS